MTTTMARRRPRTSRVAVRHVDGEGRRLAEGVRGEMTRVSVEG